MTSIQSLKTFVNIILFSIFVAFNSYADECKNRGDLDILYCDENYDLIADTPTDAKKLKNPSTLVFSFMPIENPAVYEEAFQPFTEYLAQCTGKKVNFHQVQSNSAQIEAMRSGRLHIGGFSTGSSIFAVNNAGAVPIATLVLEDNSLTPNYLFVIVKKDSNFQKLSDLKGKRVAHSSPSSNIGHMAPLALFPNEGLLPSKDYKILFSGKYDQTIMGVLSGDYDAGLTSNNVFRRMLERGQIKQEDFRIIYKSPPFPSDIFAVTHNLEPKLQEKIKECFHDFKFTKELSEMFEGTDKFGPVNYKKDWAVIREIDEKGKLNFNK